jgi:hypothetical protein
MVFADQRRRQATVLCCASRSTYHVAGGCCEGGYRGGATLEEELMYQKILKELREIKGMDWLFVLAAFIAGILLGMSWQFLHSN